MKNRPPLLTNSFSDVLAVRKTEIAGVGIDLERKAIPPEATRFFLTQSERDWVESRGMQPLDLLRLWTIKEALYKANPQNSNTVLADYSLFDPNLWAGEAFWNQGSMEFFYEAAVYRGGVLTIAVAFSL